MKLSPEVEAALVRYVEGRPRSERVRWGDILNRAFDAHGVSISRMWLSQNGAIKAAYAARRARADAEGGTYAEAEVDRLRRKVGELTETLRQYDLKFIRYIHNAQLEDVSIDKLERPLPVSKGKPKRKAG